MSSNSFIEHSNHFTELINETVALGVAQLSHLEIDQRSPLRGQIGAILRFVDDSELHIKEFFDGVHSPARTMYAYHYQDADKQLRFRYDNALHRPPLGQPDHKHTTAGIILTPMPALRDVLEEAIDWLPDSSSLPHRP